MEIRISAFTIQINYFLVLLILLLITGIFEKAFTGVLIIYMFSLAIHETGHFVLFIISGVKIKKLIFNPFGMGIITETIKHNNIWDILISASGPLANITAFLTILSINSFEIKNSFSARANLVMALFNLLPLPPLDGGNILTGLIYGKRGGRTFAEIMKYLSWAVCGALVGFSAAMYTNGIKILLNYLPVFIYMFYYSLKTPMNEIILKYRMFIKKDKWFQKDGISNCTIYSVSSDTPFGRLLCMDGKGRLKIFLILNENGMVRWILSETAVNAFALRHNPDMTIKEICSKEPDVKM